MNGLCAVELVYAGYHAGVLLKGKAKHPVYIYIKNDDVEVRDASHLWVSHQSGEPGGPPEGVEKGVSDDQHFKIASIGPAGERLFERLHRP